KDWMARGARPVLDQSSCRDGEQREPRIGFPEVWQRQLSRVDRTMKINADLGQRAVVYSEELPWVASPLPGVDRRMLERDGEEVARATSVVRYAPNSSFDAHVHGGGEE